MRNFTSSETLDLTKPVSIEINADYQVDFAMNWQANTNAVTIQVFSMSSSANACNELNARKNATFEATTSKIHFTVADDGEGSASADNCANQLKLVVTVPSNISLEVFKMSSKSGVTCLNPMGLLGACDESTDRSNTDQATSGVQSIAFNDQCTQQRYQLDVTVPDCHILALRNHSIQLKLIAPEALDYATFMYQYASKCDSKHCDCSMPLNGKADASKMIYTAAIPYTQPEKALYVYVLYKASSWSTRHQYPIDALPHQFMKASLPCAPAAHDGPCDPNSCWVALGQKGCN